VGLAVCVLFLTVIAVALGPHVGVVVSSISVEGAWYRSVLPQRVTLDHFRQALSHPLAVGSIRNSLWYASIATVLCAAMGLAISYLTVRARVRGAFLLDALAMLPLAVPGLVMAFGYVAMTLTWPFTASGLLARWASVVGNNPNPVPLLIIAYAIRRLPYVVRSASAGLEQTSVSLEEAALNLGASTSMTMRRVTLPLIAANLVGGTILAFSFAMLEVSDSLILAQKEADYPITKAIYDLFQRLGDGPCIAGAMGVWAMALLAVTLIGAAVLMGRRLGAVFRA
jgi:iron(III) transport system permease protein